MEPTPEITVKNRCYLVLRGPSGKPPKFLRTFGEFKHYVGRLAGDVVHRGRSQSLLPGLRASFP